MLDFDKVSIPNTDLVNDPEAAISALIVKCLPENFQNVTCFWQLSSRAGLTGDDLVKCHIWFWLSRPVGSAEGKAWSKAFAPDNDVSLFRRVQPHFIANPQFVGCSDPLPRRTGFLEGAQEEVDFPEGLVEFEEKVEIDYEEHGTGQGLFFQLLRLRGDIIRDHHEPNTFIVRCPNEAAHTGGEAGDSSTVLYPPAHGGDLGSIHCFHGHCEDLTAAEWLGLFEEDEIEEAKNLERPSLSRENLERFAKRLAGKADDRDAEIGAALVRVCKGDIFADLGERVAFVNRIVKTLAKRFPEYEPASLAKHFSQSLGIMRQQEPEGLVTIEDLTNRIAHAQAYHREELKKASEEEKVRTREAFKNGRSYPYTQGELETFGEHIDKRWIIQCGKGFYLFFAGSYIGPYTEVDVLNAADRDLAPAKSAGVDIKMLDKQGQTTFKPLKKIVSQYGTVAERIIVDLRAQVTVYDDPTRTIIEAPCPLRDIKPVYHEEIDNWLFLLAGEHYENLKTWIAAVTLLDRPCSALFLTGKKGVGKSLLALGLSRLWTVSGPTALDLAFAQFNDSLANCPLTFADETLPKDYKGSARNAELRLHIQALERPLKRKFLPNTKLLGATRTIVAANNKEVLRTSENLSNDDIEAIRDRYFHIAVDPDAADYLTSISTKGWVDEDMIAEHALWLRDNHVWESHGRFLVQVLDEQLHRTLTTQSGCKSNICQWLCGFLHDQMKFHNDIRTCLYVRVRDQKLLVNVKGILMKWNLYVPEHEKSPPVGILSRALIELCPTDKNSRLRYDNAKGQRMNYRVIEIENVVAWAEETGFADREEIFEALKEDSETLVARKQPQLQLN